MDSPVRMGSGRSEHARASSPPPDARRRTSQCADSENPATKSTGGPGDALREGRSFMGAERARDTRRRSGNPQMPRRSPRPHPSRLSSRFQLGTRNARDTRARLRMLQIGSGARRSHPSAQQAALFGSGVRSALDVALRAWACPYCVTIDAREIRRSRARDLPRAQGTDRARVPLHSCNTMSRALASC